ncbi:MAG: alpha-glucosidase/alpha-galactosidase [Armatimonadetes bacterium]|jgi:alpha-galactosidase|nr:alpha-glucosidase/alpha-galactosidase [Armatimonadota bacterium]
MVKVAYLGAGSVVFCKNLVGDLLSFPEFKKDVHIALHDIDQDRLQTSETVARKLAASLGAEPKITAHLTRREALDGADYVVNMVQVGGYEPATVIDFEVPKKYGLRQTIADTLGVGGIMRAVRTIPVLLEFARDMENLCPDALFLNYTNPMAMNCWGLNDGSNIKTVGLCHSVFGTAWQLANRVDVPFEEVNYICAGINHMAFFLKFEHNGRDLYPDIRKTTADWDKWQWDHVRAKALDLLGYAVTESSEHFAEYVPWFMKRDRPDIIEQLEIPLDEYIKRCKDIIGSWTETREKMLNDEDIEEHKPTREYGSYIIHSMETGQPRVIYGNVPNNGLIDNLPAGCTVEVPCLVDKSGLQPTKIGKLPTQLAALIRTNVNPQELTVQAVLNNDRQALYHAVMMDPHTAAELTPDQIIAMVDEMIEAHGDYIPKGLRS